MALSGSIGIGPVRVGASTRGRRSSDIGNGAGFLMCLIVVAPFYFAIRYWYVVLPIVGLGLLLAAIAYIVNIDGEFRAEEARKKAEIIERAEEQHARLMDGDEHAGTYGKYPPANIHD